MKKILNLLIIFCALFAGVSSLSHSETSINSRNNTLSKRSRGPILSYGGARKYLWGRKYGAVKINIWNKTPNDLEDAKWKGKDLEVETPLSRTVPPQGQAVEIVARFRKKIMFYPRTLWVSYRISETHRICIYVKLKPRKINKFADPKFMYTVYITETNACDEPKSPPVNAFVSKNKGNGYKSYWQYVNAESALASNVLAHTLNVYILSFDENLPLKNGKLQAWKTMRRQKQNLKQLQPEIAQSASTSTDVNDNENQQSPNKQGNQSNLNTQQPDVQKQIPKPANNQVGLNNQGGNEDIDQGNQESDIENQQSPNNQDTLNNQGNEDIDESNEESDIKNQQFVNNQGNPNNQERDVQNQLLLKPAAKNQQQYSNQPVVNNKLRGTDEEMGKKLARTSERMKQGTGMNFGQMKSAMSPKAIRVGRISKMKKPSEMTDMGYRYRGQ